MEEKRAETKLTIKPTEKTVEKPVEKPIIKNKYIIGVPENTKQATLVECLNQKHNSI